MYKSILSSVVVVAAVAVTLFSGCADNGVDPTDNGGNNNNNNNNNNGGGTPSVTTGTLNDSRDGRSYSTVKVGAQTWMAKNLDYDTEGGRCYDDDPANCEIYGRLYKWATAMGIDSIYNSSTWDGSDAMRQGICPAGWHLPSAAEWDILIDYAGGKDSAGTKLKSPEYWRPVTVSGVTPGTDAYGFSALPVGFGTFDGGFGAIGIFGYWWSATEDAADLAQSRYMSFLGGEVGGFGHPKQDGFAVRCVQN
jgi:uncharacterized protein (TIGR02145 family)